MKKHLQSLLILLVFIPSSVKAYSDYIIAGGENIGINIKTEGVLVVGTYDVGGELISKQSGIQTGDIITKVNEVEIKSSEDFINQLNNNGCVDTQIQYKRNEETITTNLTLKKEEEICKSGLYIKDSISGIGTLTFIDPNSKLFGALGHEIIESNSGTIVDTTNGTIFESNVVDIDKSRAGTPGGKQAKSNTENTYGTIFENTNKGIFGNYGAELDQTKLYKVASADEVKKGEAKILTVLNGNDVQEYSINIIKIVKDTKVKNIIFEITDVNLLDKTGGIVQGMSGSPIIQDNKIIGAVTHVVVNSPNKGYGIFITNMLEEAEN